MQVGKDLKSLIPKAKESEIQRTILDGLAAKRIFAFRLNTASMKVGDRFFKAHSLGKGAADILAFPLKGCDSGLGWFAFPLWIECKTVTGKSSPQQQEFGNFVREQHHDYLVARSWEDVAGWLSEHEI